LRPALGVWWKNSSGIGDGPSIDSEVPDAFSWFTSEQARANLGTLRIRGIDRLRIVDASIMPAITSGNTASPVIMIAAKAADLILR
jgi:hypothetical protein